MEDEVINQLNITLNDLEKRSEDIRVYMDYQGKKDRLEEVIGLSEDPELWNDPKRAQEIGKERKILEGIVLTLDNIASGIEDNRMLIEMTVEENDEEGFAAVQEDVSGLEKQMADLVGKIQNRGRLKIQTAHFQTARSWKKTGKSLTIRP